MNILERIVEQKRKEIETAKKRKPLSKLQDETKNARSLARRPFRNLFEQKNVLITEVKPKSPSAGTLIEVSPIDVAEIYAGSVADAISVLTDEKFFGGSPELLEEVAEIVPQPVFRKDFIIDPYQVYETAASDASAFLLIAAILSVDEMRSLRELGSSLGLDTLTEVHTKEELEKALEAGAPLLGVNNRNLKTLEIDLALTDELAPHIPREVPFVSESGITTKADVERVRAAGARGILVGTSILRAADPLRHIEELQSVLNKNT
jgi:indole-3-glycerol phosphate synthase